MPWGGHRDIDRGFVLIPVLGVRLSLLVLAAGFIITGGLALGIPHWSRVGRTFLWTVRLAAVIDDGGGTGPLDSDQLAFNVMDVRCYG